MLTTTMNNIEASLPLWDGWERLLIGLDKTLADDEPLPYARILEINGLADALRACTAEPGYAKEWRLFSVACARDASRFTNDWRVIYAINIAERFAHGMASAAQVENATAAAAAAARAADATDADAYYAYYAAAAAAAAAYDAADTATYAACAYAADAASCSAARWRQRELFLQIVI